MSTTSSSRQNTVTTHTHMTFSAEPTGTAGVGIYFQQDGADNDVYVKSLVKGASAELDGTIKLGDVIQSVDGRNVVGQSLNTLRSLIRGEVGTYVDLRFHRQDAYTGEAVSYEVSLMRGSAEYLAWKERRDLESKVAEARARVQEAESEMERLRRRIREITQEAEELRAEAHRLRPLIDAQKDALSQQQIRCKEEFEACRHLEEEIMPLTEQRERGKRELERLRKHLHQAEDQLLTAKDALDESQRRYGETAETCTKQQQARADCEGRLRKTEEELARRRDEDARSRAEQERVRHQMELDVRGLRSKLAEERHETVKASQRREAAVQHLQNLEDDRDRLEEERARLQKMLRDADAALQQSQLGKTQVETMTTELQRASVKLSDQARVQDSHIEDAKRRLLEERDRWEKSVLQVQAVRAEEHDRFVTREEQLTSEHARVSDLFQQTRMGMEAERVKLNDILGRLIPETSSLQRSLQQERNTTETVRGEMNATGKRMEEAGSALLQARDALHKAQQATQAENSARQRVDLRTRGMEEEIRRELEKEALRANFATELEKRAELEKVELAEVVRRGEEKNKHEGLARVRLEENMKVLVEKIRHLQIRERDYVSRLDEARLVHADLVARFHELVRQQQNVRASLVTVRGPYDEQHALVPARAVPRIALPGFSAPDPLSLQGPRKIAGLIAPPPPIYSSQYRSSLDAVGPLTRVR